MELGRSDVHTFLLAIVAELGWCGRAVGSTMANLVAEAAVTSELANNGRIGTFSLGMTLLTTIEAVTKLGRFGALGLVVATQIISQCRIEE